MKKRWMNVVLTIAMTVCLLAGCGGTDGADETQEPVAEEKLTLEGSYWVTETMTMEGTEFSTEDIKGIFGELDNVMALAFMKEGKVKGVLFEDHFEATYTGELESFEIQLENEVIKGSYTEEKKIILTLQDDSKMVLTCVEEIPESIAADPWITYEPEFSNEQTCTMSNYMMGGRYWVEEDVLYGLSHAESAQGALAATPFYMKGDFPEFEDTSILDGRGSATYLCKIDDVFYYIMNGEEICRINVDGSGLETLYKGACDYLQVYNDRIYFTDENYHFVSMDMNGKDLTTVVDKEIYYPYFISSDWMIFQDDGDSESLHLYNTTFGEELNITDIPSYNPVMNGKYLYFVDGTDAEKGENYLCRIDMSNPEEFLCERSEKTLSIMDYMMDGKTIYIANNTAMEMEMWKELTVSDETETQMEMYVSEGYNVYHEFDNEGLINAKYMMSVVEFGASPFN